MSQYIPSELTWEQDNQPVTLRLTHDAQLKSHHRPNSIAYSLRVQAAQPVTFNLRLRLPWWLSGAAQITLNGAALLGASSPSSYVEIDRTWTDDTLHLVFPKTLVTESLPDAPDTFGVMDGPVVLAALNPGETPIQQRTPGNASHTARPNYRISGVTLHGDPAAPTTFLRPDNEREWHYWRGDYRTHGQPQDMRFIPLYEVRDEVYTVYFTVNR